MPQIPDSPETTTDLTSEELVVARARDYDEARQRATGFHRDRVLAIEEERFADCDFHAASNNRFADNLTADDRTMGFTGTTEAPSGDGPLDRQSGEARHRFEVLQEARQRLDVLCDRADRELDEAHGALLAATEGLAAEAAEEDENGHVEGFDLVVGGGADAEAAVTGTEDTDSSGVSSAA